VANSVSNNTVDLGILICGSGNGVCMTANKHEGVRAGLAWESELASLAREHNNANVICLPARFITEDQAVEIVRAYVDAEFEGGRHETRVQKIEK
jgi:ribose 5-phosphate isomerase B